jgi:hypothetical protein
MLHSTLDASFWPQAFVSLSLCSSSLLGVREYIFVGPSTTVVA